MAYEPLVMLVWPLLLVALLQLSSLRSASFQRSRRSREWRGEWRAEKRAGDWSRTW